jgi:hypothetical protein
LASYEAEIREKDRSPHLSLETFLA